MQCAPFVLFQASGSAQQVVPFPTHRRAPPGTCPAPLTPRPPHATMTRIFRDNPEAILDDSVSLRDGLVDEHDALGVVRRIVPEWSEVEQARCTPVHGGITNGLVRLSAPDRTDVLVRVYGPNTEQVIDRERENRLFARLSEDGFAPSYLGRFRNGRVEEFLDGYRALEPHEMGDEKWRSRIALRLAELHRHPPEQAIPRTFCTLRAWLERACDLSFSGEQAAAHARLDLPGALRRLSSLTHRFHSTLAPRAVTSAGVRTAIRPILAHNDLLAGNILVDEATQTVRFIDYEYSGCGYAAFDVANHFCEYAGFDSNFADHFPPARVRESFIAAYLGPTATADDIADFDIAVRFFVLIDHMWWGSWAVVQARYSPINFDFMEYATRRFAGLHYHTHRFSRAPEERAQPLGIASDSCPSEP